MGRVTTLLRAATGRPVVLHAIVLGLLLLFSVQTLAEAFVVGGLPSLSPVQAVEDLAPPSDAFEAVEFSPGEDRDDVGTARPLVLTLTIPVEATQSGFRAAPLHSLPADLFRPPMFQR